MKPPTFEACTAPLEAAQALIDRSLALSTGAQYLQAQTGPIPMVEVVSEPDTAWSRKVNDIETPFVDEYDDTEYRGNRGLQMLNLAELSFLAESIGVAPPWRQMPTGRELAGQRMLDLGCGTGRIAIWGAANGAEVTAIDQTAGYVQATARKMALLPPSTPEPRLLVAPAEAVVADPANEAEIVTAMFGVLNHCEDWREIIANVRNVLVNNGVFVLSMYGSPEAAVYDELKRGMPYDPAILTRRAEGGILLGEAADEILPAKFPYPQEVLDALTENGFAIQQVQPFLSVTALYPREPDPNNVAAYIMTIERRYGSEVADYLSLYAANPTQLLVASLCADYMISAGRINDAAYFGVAATKEYRG